ncbi:hypothetical protein ABW21_db0207377 [Orbilia brochopaga]|nr:hypothetical protein ABW21_db0207377 [Drechslerella brochopaga]
MLNVRRTLSRLPRFSRQCLLLKRGFSDGSRPTSPIARKGLKILFCGSDTFSVQSLKALIDLKNETPNPTIESIDVLVKHEKPSGRGLKNQRLPGPTDLIVAVYSGAAPIQHALINGDSETGVVVQTLDTKKFDNGKILARSVIPLDIDVNLYPSTTFYEDCLHEFGEKGGRLLSDVIRRGLYESPKVIPSPTKTKPSLARKLPTTASLIRFGEMTGLQAFRLGLAFGNLYCFRFKTSNLRKKSKTVTLPRVLMGPLRMPTAEEFDRYLREAPAEKQWVYIPSGQEQRGKKPDKRSGLALQVSKGEWVMAKWITVEGRNRRDGRSWADIVDPTKLQLVTEDSILNKPKEAEDQE